MRFCTKREQAWSACRCEGERPHKSPAGDLPGDRSRQDARIIERPVHIDWCGWASLHHTLSKSPYGVGVRPHSPLHYFIIPMCTSPCRNCTCLRTVASEPPWYCTLAQPDTTHKPNDGKTTVVNGLSGWATRHRRRNKMSPAAIAVLVMFLVRFVLPVAVLFALGARFGSAGPHPVR